MKYLKSIGMSVINTVVVLIAYVLIGNTFLATTGQYGDQINLSSILTITLCIGILMGMTLLESKKMKLPFWITFSSSLVIIAIVGVGMSIAVNVIAGGIG